MELHCISALQENGRVTTVSGWMADALTPTGSNVGYGICRQFRRRAALRFRNPPRIWTTMAYRCLNSVPPNRVIILGIFTVGAMEMARITE